MATMKNEVVNTFATRYQTSIYEALYIPGNPDFPSVYTYRKTENPSSVHIATQKTIDGFVSQKGNFKTPNAHSYNKTYIVNNSGSYTEITLYPGQGGQYEKFTTITTGPTGEGSAGSTINRSLLENLAYNKCLERLYESLRGKLDLSVAAAESGKTVKMLRSFVKLNRFIRRWDFKEVANTWLEFTYGFKPLAQDLYGIAEEVMRQSVQTQVVKFRATQKDDERVYSAGYRLNRTATSKASARCEVKFLWTPTNGQLDTLGRFTSLNPASIAWELLPFSFVGDWFVDIGGFLRNAESALSISGTVGNGYITQSYKETTELISKGVGVHPLDPNVTTIADLKSVTYQVSLRRGLIYSLPFPQRPRFNPSLGASRLLSAAALLSQFIKGQPNFGPKAPSLKISNYRFKKAKDRLTRKDRRFERDRDDIARQLSRT